MIGSSVFAQLQSLNTSLNLGLTTRKGILRIFPNYVRMDSKLYPQIVYDVTNYEEENGFDGPTGTAVCDVKILTVGQTYDDANALAQSIAPALDGMRGTWGTTIIQGCFLEDVAEDHFVDTDMETILYFVKEMTFKVSLIV